MADDIIFFGFSGNPPTKAHIAIVDYISKNYPDRKIIVAPVYKHVFDNKSGLAEFDHRLAMAKLAFANMKNVIVSDIERKVAELRNERIGTIDIVSYLKSGNLSSDDIKVTLVLGADTANDLMANKWKRSAELIIACTNILILPRPGYELKSNEGNTKFQALENPDWGVIFTDEGLKSMSSTKARNGGEGEAYLTDSIKQYILNNNLYYCSIEKYPVKKPRIDSTL